MSNLKVRKIGNSLGVIFPKELQEALKVSEGDQIGATILENNNVVLGSFLSHHSLWEFPESDLNNEDQLWLDADLEDADDESQI